MHIPRLANVVNVVEMYFIVYFNGIHALYWRGSYMLGAECVYEAECVPSLTRVQGGAHTCLVQSVCTKHMRPFINPSSGRGSYMLGAERVYEAHEALH